MARTGGNMRLARPRTMLATVRQWLKEWLKEMATTREPQEGHRPAHGEGSFYWRARDERWVGTIEAGWTPKGTRRRVVVTDKDEDRAWDKLQAKRKQIEQDGIAAALQRDTTVAAWIREWLKIQERTLRPNTYNGHSSYMRKWVIPAIGRRPLSELRAADIRKVADDVVDAGRSSTTAGTIQGVLQKCLRDAKMEGYSVPEPPLLVPKPEKNTDHGRAAIPVPDAIKLLRHALDHVQDGSKWVAALWQGMRQGERLGLLWENVDFDAKVITIQWQLQELVRNDSGGYRVPRNYNKVQIDGRWHLVAPKSATSVREIPLLPELELALKKWRKTAPECPHGLVWGFATPDADRADWEALQAAAKVKKVYRRGQSGQPHYLLHEARHTTATLLLEAGVDPEVIKAIMGHSNVVTTAGYQHVSLEMMRDALSRSGKLLALGS